MATDRHRPRWTRSGPAGRRWPAGRCWPTGSATCCSGWPWRSFVVAFLVGFTGALVTAIVASMVVGSLLLAPSIVLGYAVKAAEKEDRARGSDPDPAGTRKRRHGPGVGVTIR